MTNELFERLLYEEESPTLDFKKEQYRFAKATDDEKSELLKDILGFVNAWRRAEAYILIGVEDVRGGRGNVFGIPHSDHFEDHCLQQFVNNMTNRPVLFHYEAFGFEGKQVGILHMEQQLRPIYLKRDYGKLQKEKVDVRRGSSTDPAKPASLDEVARMGQSSPPEQAVLVVAFADLEGDSSLGARRAWDAEFCEMPPMESIPELVQQRPRHPLGIDLSMIHSDPMNRLNESYYREMANYEFFRRLFRPVRVLVKNIAQVAAKNVRAELIVPTDVGVAVLDPSETPDPPRRKADFVSNAIMKGIRPVRRDPGDVTIDKNNDRFRVGIDCGDLQPGRSIKSDEFFIGKGQSGEVALLGQVFAENLLEPKSFSLTISVNINNTSMTVDDLQRLPEPVTTDV